MFVCYEHEHNDDDEVTFLAATNFNFKELKFKDGRKKQTRNT